MKFQKEENQISLSIPMPEDIEKIRIVGRPRFLQVSETMDPQNQRILYIVCREPKYFASFEAFCELVEKNIETKHLPAISVFLNLLRVWDWTEKRRIA